MLESIVSFISSPFFKSLLAIVFILLPFESVIYISTPSIPRNLLSYILSKPDLPIILFAV